MVTRHLALLACLLCLLFSSARASTYLVTTTDASGANSLSAAIDSVNTHAGPDSIHFNIPGLAPHKIVVAVCSDPYVLNGDDTVLDGYTQPGSALNTAKIGNPFNGIIAVEISPASFCTQNRALTINGARNVVRGIRIGGAFTYGVVVNGDNAMIEGCDIEDAGYGISVRPSSGVRIGGITTASRNLIFENYYGIYVGGESGNPVSDLVIQGNYIGTKYTQPGINVDGVYVYGYTTGAMIGGHLSAPCTSNGAMNVITLNSRDGIVVEGDEVSGISILSNIIHSNGQAGIDLAYDGPTSNDVRDDDNGPNLRQNFPRIVASQGNSIFGLLESTPNRTFTIQVFDNHSSACDPSGHGQGKLIYGETQIVTDQFGYATFTVSCGPVVAGHYYTATATDDEGNTSEFSECFESTAAVTAASGVPAVFALHANVPNPFNPATIIPFEMGAAGNLDIVIFDTAGRRVRTLVSEQRAAGPGSAQWDGRDEHGKAVASGVYFCRMTAGDFSASRKIVLLK